MRPASSPHSLRGVLASGAVCSALALAAAGCGSGSTPAAQGSGAPSATHHPMASHSEPMAHHMTARFGPDCGMVPASGMGSFHSMSMEPVVAAASHSPLLTTFAADAGKVGLTAKLNSAHSITVFAPANSAFAKLHGSAMSMLENHADLTEILRYHVVSGRLTPADLAAGTEARTLQGGTSKLSKMGAVYEVNNAHVICGNIQTANAIVYIISTVLEPMHMH